MADNRPELCASCKRAPVASGPLCRSCAELADEAEKRRQGGGSRGARGGTRNPSGLPSGQGADRASLRSSALWPGITWGNNALCSCSWAFRGVMQVKARNAGCLVHIRDRPAGTA